jgi:hypothetical protein
MNTIVPQSNTSPPQPVFTVIVILIVLGQVASLTLYSKNVISTEVQQR